MSRPPATRGIQAWPEECWEEAHAHAVACYPKHNFTLVSFYPDFNRTDLVRTTPSEILSRYENHDSANSLR
jgi:hypothetical protein